MFTRTFFFSFLFWLGVAGFAQSSDDNISIPREIHTRLWEVPGPQQDEPGAPRLLIVWPAADTDPMEGPTAHYAGRVEPVDATVKLNGEKLKIYPGGVFTGLKDAPIPGQSATWEFEATAKDKSTTVKRIVRAWAPPPPAP